MNDIEKAIENLKGIKSAHFATVTKETTETVEKIVIEDLESIDLAISALEKQLNGGWIPVSERLPEKEDIYQVTIKYENFAGIHLTVRTAIYENEKWNIHGPQPVISNRKIIAWQPLPEPYREVEN